MPLGAADQRRHRILHINPAGGEGRGDAVLEAQHRLAGFVTVGAVFAADALDVLEVKCREQIIGEDDARAQPCVLAC